MNLVLPSTDRTRTPDDPLDWARTRLAAGEAVALATVATTWGSAPVPVGGTMAIAGGLRFAGSVSGGCVESEVIATAEQVIASGEARVLSFGIADETAWRAGLPCGGNIELVLERWRPADLALLDRVLEARRDRTPAVVTTRLADGSRDFAIVPALAVSAPHAELVDDPSGRVFVRRHLPTVRVVVIGGTEIGQVLARLATDVGWDVAVVDPRSAFLTGERFPGARRLPDWPAAALDALRLDTATAVVAVTHVGDIDDEALAAALVSPCFYVGALGSRRTHAKRCERLAARGLAPDGIARMHAPVGLAIGALGPREIAVSILAEIVREWRQPSGQAASQSP